MTSPIFEPGLLVGFFTVPGITLLLLSQHLWPWETPARRQLALAALWGAAGTLAFLATDSELAIGVAVLGFMLSWIAGRFLRDYYLAGQVLLPASLINLTCMIGWCLAFIETLPISSLTRHLLSVYVGLLLLAPLVGLRRLLVTQSYLLRKRWHRPRHSLDPEPREHYPKVSFHVPCYAEPPDVVCSTLDALSRMRYSNFEVVVVDNNTDDPKLWQPLESHCERLNALNDNNVFRFFHVDRLPGAKAGALNFAHRNTATDAELIAVIDADYQAQPDFLERLVGFFDDPKIGYVQTPHDYRGWEKNLYQRACYWEYTSFFHLKLPCLNEWVATYVIGTMCVLRRRALEEAGGWAEWCLTEDSEASVRIHALGYESIFLAEPFGRGLIPETFRGYKMQRLRWTIGPIQQLFRHWRLYLPGVIAAPSRLNPWQRRLEAARGMGGIKAGLFLALLCMALVTLGSILHHQEVIAMPAVLWLGFLLVAPAALGNRWLTYRLAGCRLVSDMVLGTLAATSLMYIRFVGGILALSGRRTLKWQRTSKFKALPDSLEALRSVQAEVLLALVLMILGCALAPYASFRPPDLLFVVTVGLWGSAVVNLAAPIMALLAELQLRR